MSAKYLYPTICALIFYSVSHAELAQQSYAKPTVAENYALWGYSVAIDGDRMVVGAPFEDSGGTNRGVVYVYRWQSNNTWYRELRLKGVGSQDRFGHAVAISGNTMVVGYPHDDSNATGVGGSQLDNSAEQAGAAAVYTRRGNTWSFQAYLKASNAEANDLFGSSVSISGDTIVVGAIGEGSQATGVNGREDWDDFGSPDSGAAYVFVRNGNVWTQQAYLKASNTKSGNEFGSSVSISGDTIAVGAPYEDSDSIGVNGSNFNTGTSRSGAVYVFKRSGANWAQQAYVKASNTGSSDNFGTALAISGNVMVVGAPNEDGGIGGVNVSDGNNSAPNSGAAYVFKRVGSSWSQEAYLKAESPGNNDNFAQSVAVASSSIVIGCYHEDGGSRGVNRDQSNNSAEDSGAAYVFKSSGSVWAQTHYLKASNSDAGDLFGRSVAVSNGVIAVGAISEDSNSEGGDGGPDPNQNNLGANAGAVYTFAEASIVNNQISIENESHTALSNGATVQFDNTILTKSSTKTIIIKNFGNGTLVFNQFNLSSPNGEFSIDTTQTASEIGAGAETSIEISFNPSATGTRGASLSITSNDNGNSPFSLFLSGTGITAYGGWGANHGLEGADLAPSAQPHNDGLPNLLKFAFNMNGSGSDNSVLMPSSGTSGLPVYSIINNGSNIVFRVEYIRRKNAGVSYVPKYNNNLSETGWAEFTSTPAVTTINADWERVIHEHSFDNATTSKLFGRLEVSLE